MSWFRVDNRLIHGQIIEGWLPYLDARRLIVANASLAADELRRQILLLAVPSRIQTDFVTVPAAAALSAAAPSENALFLFTDCRDARTFFEFGGGMGTLNIGNMHYAKGNVQICAHVSVSEQDLECMRFLASQGVEFDLRSVPGDVPDLSVWRQLGMQPAEM